MNPDTGAMVNTAFEGWAILELMGHRRLAGYVREVELAGAKVLRIDVPGPIEGGRLDRVKATQFYGGHALFCLTPTTEETARQVAAALDTPAPVQHWEIPRLPSPEERERARGYDPEDDEESPSDEGDE